MGVLRGLTMVTVGAAVTLLGAALLAEPLLHEFFDTSGVSGTQVSSPAAPISGFPARLGTPSGTVTAPPERRSTKEASYAQAQAVNDKYRLDGDTSRPDLVGYSDPFTPSVLPFKRSFAYDTVTEGLELAVDDPKLKPVTVGDRVRPGDDQFFADLSVSVREGQPVRIPSVGPQARILAAKLQPPVEFSIARDSAENWFLTAPKGEYRVVMHLAIERRVFGSPFGDVSWRQLGKYLPRLPPSLTQATAQVLSSLSLDQQTPPNQALRTLVRHFRGFLPSEQRYQSVGAQLYQDIALSQTGVCRHRAFGFVVTALGLGLPARFVRNEAHAWVEVFDGKIWHRVDLGGAAGRMEMGSDVEVAHAPPTDPYSWPSGSESGRDMASDALSSASQPGAGTGAAAETRVAESEPPASPESGDSSGDIAPALESNPEPTAVLLQTELKRATRGDPLQVSGQVSSLGKPCDLLRVDIKLQSAAGQWYSLGALVTDERGRYGGQVVVPAGVPVGDYEIFAFTPGNQSCAAASSLDAEAAR